MSIDEDILALRAAAARPSNRDIAELMQAVRAAEVVDLTDIPALTGGPFFNPMDPQFAGGAKLDGVADDFAAFTAAIAAAAAAGGGVVKSPPGVALTSDTIVLPSRVSLVGSGMGATTVKIADGVNKDVIRSSGFSTLTGTGAWLSSDGVPFAFAIQELSIDGNKANNASGRGVALYAKNFHINNVIVRDCAGDGFYSEAGSVSGQTDWTDLPESYIERLWCRNNGGKGFNFKGPHNSHIGYLITAYNGDWGAYFDTDGSTFNGNVTEAALIHSYANASDNGIYLGAVVAVNRMVTDGDNPTIASNSCTIDRLKMLNAGGGRDGLVLSASQCFINQVEVVSIASTAAARDIIQISGDRNQLGLVRVAGNSHDNVGVHLTGVQNSIADLIVRECNGAGTSRGIVYGGTDNRVTGHLSNNSTNLEYTGTARNRLVFDIFTAAGQTVRTGTVVTTDEWHITASGDVVESWVVFPSYPTLPTIQTQTGATYTFVLADRDRLTQFDRSTAQTITIPTEASVAYPVGTQMHLARVNTGTLTVVGDTGVTVNGAPGLKLRSQWSVATAIKTATNTWLLTGDLSA